MSPQLTTILGYQPSDWADAEGWLATVHPDDRERARILDWSILDAGGYEMEYRILHGDGSVRWVHDQGHVLSWHYRGHPSEFQGLITDVTQAKQLEQERREADTRYRSLVEALPATTYLEYASPTDPRESRFAYVSPHIEQSLGYTPDEATSDPHFFERTLHPDDRERIGEANARAERTGEPFDEEFRQLTKDGRIRWMHDRAVLVRDEHGAPRFWHGVTIDITDRKVAESHLRTLQTRYRELAGWVAREPGLDPS